MDYGTTYLILACVIGLIMAFGIGANDVANAIGTSVGSKALTIRQAIIIAAIFEATGAMFAGGEVTNTIRNQIIDADLLLLNDPKLIVFGMMAASLSAGVWLLVASFRGWPVSTTHSIVGSLIGFGAISLGFDSVHWGVVISIFCSWVFTPIIAGFCAFLIFRSIQKTILAKKNPVFYAKRYLPVYIFIATVVVSMVTLTKGLKHVGLGFTIYQDIILSLVFSVVIVVFSVFLLRRVKSDPNVGIREKHKQVERVFGLLMVFTACSMAFAHGSNDVANAIAPLAAVTNIVRGGVAESVAIPIWVLFIGAIGIVLGLVLYGYKIIITIGHNITNLTPSRGFSAELSAAATVILASAIGMPVSTTQTLVGAILGVGFARGISALNLKVVRKIFMSWFITLPVGATMAVIFYYLFRGIFAFVDYLNSPI